jgi:integrase
VAVKQRPDGSWRARVRVDGRERARHFARKVDAERWERQQRVDITAGTWVDPRLGEVTVAAYGATWWIGLAGRDSYRESVRGHLVNHVDPVLGRRPIGKLRAPELREWLTGLADKGLAPTTVENIARTLSMMLRAAVRERVIPSNTFDGIRIPSPPPRLVVPLTVPELQALVAAAPERWRALVLLGAGCGLRIGEAMGMSPAAVDVERRRVRVVRQLLAPIGGTDRFRLGPPKTRTSTREVALPAHVAEALAWHERRWPGAELDGVPLYFTGARGAFLHRTPVANMLAAASLVAGLNQRVKFHALRHHYASLLIASGLSVKAVQTALGHATAAETLDTYGHLWPAEGDALATAVERAWQNTAAHGRVMQ